METFLRDLDGINENQDFPEDKIDQSGDDCTENPFNDIIQNNQPLDEKPVKKSQNNEIPDETLAVAINGWYRLPDEIVEKILTQAMQSSNHVCKTYYITS